MRTAAATKASNVRQNIQVILLTDELRVELGRENWIRKLADVCLEQPTHSVRVIAHTIFGQVHSERIGVVCLAQLVNQTV